MFSDPSTIIPQLDLQSGARVADLGAGSGFFALAAAKAVGGAGRVYAIDVKKDLPQKVKNTATSQGLLNVEAVWGDVEVVGGTKLKDKSVDAAIIANLLFQLQDKNGFFAETTRILKNKGKILVVDWKDSFGGLGPKASEVITADQAKTMFEKAGFRFEKEINAGEHHYGLVFRKI